MFIEIITKKNEVILMNIKRISIVTPCKNGVTIIDEDGDFWNLAESYESFTNRLQALLDIKK